MPLLDAAELDLLGRILEKPELQPFFFRKVKELKWFNALDEKGFFQPEKNPPPTPAPEQGYVNVPFWPATEYLVAVSEELLERKNKQYAARVLNILRAATRYAQEHAFTNYRTWWQFAKVVQQIPVDLLSLDDIGLIDYWFDDPYDRSLVGSEIGAKWLVHLLENENEHSKRLALSLIDVLFKTNIAETTPTGQTRKGLLRFDDWHAEKISEKVAKKAGLKLGIEAARVFQSRLEAVLQKTNNDKWSSVWRRAIEDHDQDKYNHNVESILVSTFRDCLLGAIDAEPGSSASYVDQLLGSDYQTVRRIGIHAVSERFHLLRDLLARLLNSDFFASNFRHEMWHLLNKRYSEFPDIQRQSVMAIIAKHEESDDKGTLREGATAYWRAIWLAAVKHHDQELAAQYAKEVATAGSAPEHPDFSSYMTSGWVVHKSPYTLEELLGLDTTALVGVLQSYKDPGDFLGPGIEGLAKTIRQLIKTEPMRYALALDQFLALDSAYIYEVIEAYHELWSQKASLPWDDLWANLLSFCEGLFARDEFWKEENAQKRKSFVANRYWIVGGAARLIEDGVKSDDHAFNERFLSQAKKIILRLLDKESGEDLSTEKDAVSVAINSPRGRCIEALINISLRASRLSDKSLGNHDVVWDEYRPIYGGELQRAGSGEFEFATLISNYLPNFVYLSKDWTFSHLDQIFDQRNIKRWRCAMQGYSYVGFIYEEVYKHLKGHGDFIRALDDELISNQVRDRVIDNIAVGFLSDYEPLNAPDSLVRVLLQRNRYAEISHLIWFIWTLRDAKDEKLIAKVMALWPVVNAAIDTNTADGRKIASHLCTWISFVETVDEVTKPLISAVAPFADESHNAFEILEAIARISKNQPSEAHEIWLRVLERAHPNYPEEALATALENIASNGAKGRRSAKQIVDEYLKAGDERPALLLARVPKP